MHGEQLIMFLIMLVLGALAFYYSRRASDSEYRATRLEKELESLKKDYSFSLDRFDTIYNSLKETENSLEKLKEKNRELQKRIDEIDLEEYRKEMEREERLEKRRRNTKSKGA